MKAAAGEERNEQQAEVEDDITEITSAEIEMALRNMKNGKATGPDNLPVEVWKSLGRTGVNLLKEALNKITDEEKIPDIWRKSILIPIYKNKGDILNCGNYRGIKLMCHSMKLYERVHENRLRNIVSISEEQFGFVKGKSTTDAIFALRQLQESYREGQHDLHCVFIDLEKAYDRFRGKNCIGAHARQGGAREVHHTGEGHVPSMRNCSEVCCRNRRTLCSGSWTPPRIRFQPVPV